MPYDQAFFDTIREGTKRSAKLVVPLLIDALAPTDRSVIDVGCGEGWWGAEFAERYFRATGVDHGCESTQIPTIDHDLERDFPPLSRYGLALCLEVAEHLTPQRGPSFVTDLCRLSDIIVFSAAIPGQGGTGHLNERWPVYWVRLFAQHDFACSGALRWKIWDDDRIENWYCQNLLVFARHPDQLPELFMSPMAPPWPVVHPVLFEARHGA